MSQNNIVNVDLGNIENTCFVVMPFGPLFDAEYETSLRPVIESMGLKCIRADEVYAKARVVDDIWKCIRSCRIVLAELTGRNPNVLYEVGLAHAIGKPVIIITRQEDDVPFDLRALRYLFYDTNDPFWGDNLQKALKSIIDSVMKEVGISRYLEDVSWGNEIVYPSLQDASLKVKESPVQVEDVSGVWKVRFSLESETKHNGLMSLQQQGTKISATMTITYDVEEGMCIVQEVFSGSLNEDMVSLRGVNYSWVQRLKESTYNLDNFEVKLSSDKRRMKGEFTSRDEKGTALFQKRGPAKSAKSE